ncbi:MAG: hypothetical protein AAF658_21340, partial [Myxococcota bacterium]
MNKYGLRKRARRCPNMRPTLLRNLAAIAHVAPALAERLTFAVSSDHVRELGGQARITYRRAAHPLEHGYPERFAATEWIAVGASDPRIVAGWLASGGIVHLWDRDPWLMRRFLSTHDFSHAIANKSLTLHLGADLVELVDLGLPLVVHETLGLLYRSEVALIKGGKRPRAIVVEGELMVDDAIEAVEAEGFPVYRLDVSVPSIEEIAYTLLRLVPSFVLTINHRPGLGLLCASRGIPLLAWEIDPSISAWASCDDNAHVSIFTYRASTL